MKLSCGFKLCTDTNKRIRLGKVFASCVCKHTGQLQQFIKRTWVICFMLDMFRMYLPCGRQSSQNITNGFGQGLTWESQFFMGKLQFITVQKVALEYQPPRRWHRFHWKSFWSSQENWRYPESTNNSWYPAWGMIFFTYQNNHRGGKSSMTQNLKFLAFSRTS